MDTSETYITPWFKPPPAKGVLLIEVWIHDRWTNTLKLLWARKGDENGYRP
jgi:hypothetical protein